MNLNDINLFIKKYKEINNIKDEEDMDIIDVKCSE
jgi:hypothetical protein